MSFFSDLIEGNFGNLGHDIGGNTIAEVGGTIAAVALPFLAPEIGAALGLGELGLGAADAGGLAADLGLADIGGAAAADAGGLAAELGLGDIGAAAAADAAGTTAADVFGDFGAFLPTTATDLAPFGDALAFAPDAVSGGGDFASLTPFSDLSAGDFGISGPGLGEDVTASPELAPFLTDTGFAPSATPAGFAPTDAELLGGQTGTAPLGASGGAGTTSGGGAATGGGGITDTLKGVASSPWTRLAVGAAPLALALARGEAQLPSAAVAAQGNAAALSTFGQQQLAMGQAGQLNAGQLAMLQQMRQDLTNQFRQALYNQGVTNPQADTRWAQMEAQIDMQVTAQTAVMIQQEIQNGLTALGSAGSELNQIAQMQMTADQNFTNTLVNATKALAFAIPGSRPSVNLGGGLALSQAA